MKILWKLTTFLSDHALEWVKKGYKKWSIFEKQKGLPYRFLLILALFEIPLECPVFTTFWRSEGFNRPVLLASGWNRWIMNGGPWGLGYAGSWSFNEAFLCGPPFWDLCSHRAAFCESPEMPRFHNGIPGILEVAVTRGQACVLGESSKLLGCILSIQRTSDPHMSLLVSTGDTKSEASLKLS